MENNKSMPLVSIVIPVYNGSNYMREAIDSALAQDYENKEIIVVNDGSTDGGATEEIALSYGDSIRYLHKENGGVSSALNLGIANMRGEYFSWLSHDDRYLPHKVSDIMSILEKYDNKSIIGLCEEAHIDAESKRLGDIPKRKRFALDRVAGPEEVLRELIEHGCFNGCALMIPKSVFKWCGGFDESLRYAQDWLMWLTIFLKGYSLVYTDTVGVENRVHAGQLTNTGIALFHRDSEVIGDILLPELLRKSSRKNNFLYMFAKNNARYGNFSVVKKCIAAGRERGIISLSHRIRLSALSLYGRIRPFIRKVYYKVVKGV